MKGFQAEQSRYEKELATWKHDKKTTDDPPEPPDAPLAERYIISDTTVEALAPLLKENPRGLLLYRDELAGWFGSFDQYKSGKAGADAAHWLSMFNGESIIVDRKTGLKTTFVPEAAVWVTGGIQPGVLHRALGQEHRESGLAARMLLCCPPRKPKRWTEADISQSTEAAIELLLDRLYDLKTTVGPDGNHQAVILKLTRDAKFRFKQFVNSHGKEQVELSGDLSAAWSKLEEYAARLALVIHLCRWAAGDPHLQDAEMVDGESMKAGIAMVDWFKHETRRVYAMLSESDDDREERRLIEWIERKRGSVTAREVQQGHRQYRTAQDAEAALNELVKVGCGHWESSPHGQRGQPTRRFVLISASPVYGNTLNPEENGNTVDVDSVDIPDTQPDDDWGEL